jgi:hypothetical protein
MPPDAMQCVKGLAALLPESTLEEYLSSENFATFCREHDLADTWKEHLESSQDRPDLYGFDSTRHAFILFFDHLFQTRRSEFPGILSGFLSDFRKWNACPLPLDAIKRECADLVFPDMTIEHEW